MDKVKEESTSHLEQILKRVDSFDTADRMTREHAKEPKPFHILFSEYIAEHGLQASEVYALSGVDRNYVYNITSGKRKHPGRDKIIALCIASGMSVEEVNRTLRTCEVNALYPKNARDIRLAACINQGMRDITKINIVLDEEGLPPLDV